MAAVTLSFSKVGNVWQATTDSLGNMVMQIKRKAPGDITIEQYIDGMDPVACVGLRKKGLNELVPFSSVKGLKIKITSDSEVEKAMLMEAIYEGSSGGGPVPGNILTESDVVNDLNSDASDKVLSAAQGKALKQLIPTDAVKTGDIINNLTSDNTDKPLSAAQGKALKQLIPTDAVKTGDIINNLTSDDTNKPLSAAQGKELKKQLDAKVIPGAATTAKAGLVKKMAAVAKPTDSTPEQLKICLESLIDSAKTALMME